MTFIHLSWASGCRPPSMLGLSVAPALAFRPAVRSGQHALIVPNQPPAAVSGYTRFVVVMRRGGMGEASNRARPVSMSTTSGDRDSLVHCTVSTLVTTVVTSLLQFSDYDARHPLVMTVVALI